MRRTNWIIFCRVVDYFGDAGFCWRLAGALARCGVGTVILVMDRLDVLEAIRGTERFDNVTVLPWNVIEDEWARAGVPAEHQADVVIEAFACSPPQCYLASLGCGARWFTLDYLATEPWADSVHGCASPAPRITSTVGRKRRWCVPGFSRATGGLLHGSWRHISARKRQDWRTELAGYPISDDIFLVLAFGYPDASWSELRSLLTGRLPEGFRDWLLWQPSGIDFSQSQFDEILQACDLNFVRGEDSFIRAHWASAGRWRVPFIWQPYRQEGQGHSHKLAGWMQQVLVDPKLSVLIDFHWGWNGLRAVDTHHDLPLESAWEGLVGGFAGVKERLHRACLQLAGRPSLEGSLIEMAETARI